MIIRPLTPDFPPDACDDLVARALGPGGEALRFSATMTIYLRPANSGRRELTVRAGTGRLFPCRTGDVPAPAYPPGPAGPALDLGPRGLAAPDPGTPVATHG